MFAWDTCIILSPQLSPTSGSGWPGTPEDLLQVTTQQIAGGLFNFYGDAQSGGAQASCSINNAGQVPAVTSLEIPRGSLAQQIQLTSWISSGSWTSSYGATTTATVTPLTYMWGPNPRGPGMNLRQISQAQSVGEWCLLAVNSVFNHYYWINEPVSIPPCLHTDNLTDLSNFGSYTFLTGSGPSSWEWDKDLITRMGPLLMQASDMRGSSLLSNVSNVIRQACHHGCFASPESPPPGLCPFLP